MQENGITLCKGSGYGRNNRKRGTRGGELRENGAHRAVEIHNVIVGDDRKRGRTKSAKKRETGWLPPSYTCEE